MITLYIAVVTFVVLSTLALLCIMYFRKRAASANDTRSSFTKVEPKSESASVACTTPQNKAEPRPCQLSPKKISLSSLKKLVPIRYMDDDLLSLIHKESEPIGTGSILFRAEEPVDSVIFLLQGTVAVETEGNRKYEVNAGTTKAHFPLSSGKKHSATGYAKTDVQLLRVPNKIMEMGAKTKRNNMMSVNFEQLDVPDELHLSGLVHSFFQHLEKNDIQLPSLPDVSMKLRRAIKDDVSVAEAAKIVQLDPSIVAKLIQVANSPIYMTSNPVNRCQDAITRLGMVATRDLVTSISLHHVFRSNQPQIKEHLVNLWKHSITLSSICFVLAQKTKRIDPDKALLAGLLADIGVIPFLHFAENFPSELFDTDELNAAIPYIRGAAGTIVLRQWDFPDNLAEIPSLAEDWYHDSGSELTLSDIVVLAKLHSYIGTPRMAELPFVNTIPAYGKLGNVGLSPELSLNLLHDAQEQINTAKNFF